MTRISYIHSVPQNEFADRGRQVKGSYYVPYNEITVGEMRLLLMRDRLNMLANFYPEAKEYRAAERLIDNALYGDVRKGVSFVGVIENELQYAASLINQAASQNAPAVRGLNAVSFRKGGIGELNINVLGQRTYNCAKAILDADQSYKFASAMTRKQKENAAVAQCEQRIKVENIINANLKDTGHHMVYKSIDKTYSAIPNRVDIKRVLQIGGVEGLANTAKMQDAGLMDEWIENAILQKNLQKSVGPWNSVKTSFALSPDPEAMLLAYVGNDLKRKKWGNSYSSINLDPATIAVVSSIIVAAIKAANAILSELRQTSVLAMQTVQGFGTEQFRAEQSDWTTSGGGTGSGGLGIDQNTLMLGGAAVAAYLLLSDK